jgi:predicted metalloprotease
MLGWLSMARRCGVQYNENARLDPSQMGSGGGRGRGTTVALGGGGILVLLIALLFGLNPGDLLGGGTAPAGTGNAPNPYAQCTQGSDISKDRSCRFVAYTNSIQAYWAKAYSGYQQTQTVIFQGQEATGCGTATAQVGPFYCPADKIVYLDDSFFDDMLKGQLGAKGGDAAEAYVIAHEYGHHISDLTGALAKAQSAGNSTGPKSAQVRLELQADCYAGAWLANASADPNSPIKALTPDDVTRAVDAALAVGDDRIQLKSTGSVSPESWTHGSSAMRKKWLAKGFNSGDPRQCDTFAAGALD